MGEGRAKVAFVLEDAIEQFGWHILEDLQYPPSFEGDVLIHCIYCPQLVPVRDE